jgi:hypothetical protein
MTLSAGNYWRKYAAFVEDWQFGLNWRDQRRKLFTGEGIRLDSNTYRLNWTHAGAGAIYYNIARTNRLSTAESFLFGLGGSMAWEYVAEWREVASINDQVFTTMGGPAIGEPFFQVASYFRNRMGAGNRLLTLLTNPILALNDTLDGSRRPPRTPTDEDHDFRFAAGGQSGALSADGRRLAPAVFSLDMRVVTLPKYGAAGEGRGRIGSTLDSSIAAVVHAENGSLGEFSVATRSTLFGWWWKRVTADDGGTRHGFDAWLGGAVAWDVWQKKAIAPYDGHELGMTYRWFEREQPTRYADKLSTVRFPGPAFALTRYAGAVRARLDLQASIDFGLVNSLAVNRYSADHDVEGVKTTLHNWGYYYALGTTAAGRFEVEGGPVRGTARFERRSYTSIQGHDRYQADMTDDGRLHDSRLEYGGDLAVQVPRSSAFVSVGVDRLARRGGFHDVVERSGETRVTWMIGARF